MPQTKRVHLSRSLRCVRCADDDVIGALVAADPAEADVSEAGGSLVAADSRTHRCRQGRRLDGHHRRVRLGSLSAPNPCAYWQLRRHARRDGPWTAIDVAYLSGGLTLAGYRYLSEWSGVHAALIVIARRSVLLSAALVYYGRVLFHDGSPWESGPQRRTQAPSKVNGRGVGFRVEVVQSGGQRLQQHSDAIAVLQCVSGSHRLAIQLFVVRVDADGLSLARRSAASRV
jgi:hypothetical protein